MLMKYWRVPARNLCCTRKLPQINGIFRKRVQNSYFPKWLSFFTFFAAGYTKDSDKMTVLVFVLAPTF